MVFKLSKKVHSCNFVLTSAWNLSLKQFTNIRVKGLIMHSQKMVLFIMLTYCFGYIRAWIQRILLNFCWVSIFFDILISNISWSVDQTPINHIVFWKSVIRTFGCIYFNCFDMLKFLAQHCKKWNLFGQFKDHNSGRKHKNWTNDLITFICFFRSNCFSYLLLYFKIVKIHSHVVSPLVHSGL